MDSTPIYIPHPTVNYDATGNNPGSPVPLVDELKKLIKTAKTPLLDHHPADKLKVVGHLAQKRPLRATKVLEDLLLGQLPERGRIHVVTETDEPKSARADAANDRADAVSEQRRHLFLLGAVLLYILWTAIMKLIGKLPDGSPPCTL
ncbi:hypothetical protein BGZ93_011127 [Podila epicladia]|nr:hypothetical protein BGZ93_011127 [Podila epicladia]